MNSSPEFPFHGRWSLAWRYLCSGSQYNGTNPARVKEWRKDLALGFRICYYKVPYIPSANIWLAKKKNCYVIPKCKGTKSNQPMLLKVPGYWWGTLIQLVSLLSLCYINDLIFRYLHLNKSPLVGHSHPE